MNQTLEELSEHGSAALVLKLGAEAGCRARPG